MIGALDRFRELPLMFFADAAAPVTAHIVKGAHDAALVPQDDDALPRELEYEVVAAFGNLLLPVHAEPLPGEDALHLFGEHRGVEEVAAGQGHLPVGGEFTRLPND
jgi:hypothetical protein